MQIFENFDEKKASLMRVLIDLVANLASHKYALDRFHSEGMTQLILGLIGAAEGYPGMLMVCVDAIDCLCQNSAIEQFLVTERGIGEVVVSLLRTQSDFKLLLKCMRLLTNLTINQAYHRPILDAGLLSVLANCVIPHFFPHKLPPEHTKKMGTYITKVLSRTYQAKPPAEVVIKCGYLDCLLRMLETADPIEDSQVEILYQYATLLPKHLNRRAFMAALRAIGKKIQA